MTLKVDPGVTYSVSAEYFVDKSSCDTNGDVHSSIRFCIPSITVCPDKFDRKFYKQSNCPLSIRGSLVNKWGKLSGTFLANGPQATLYLAQFGDEDWYVNDITVTPCNTANAKTYSSGCVVSSCNTGWSVSADKAKCVANVCSCQNGIAPSGEKCPIDGVKKCASCNTGWRLNSGKTECMANHCECLNGVAPSGEKCLSDGAKICVSCDPGFKLDLNTTQEQELNPSFDRRLRLVKFEEQPEDTPQEEQQQTTTQQATTQQATTQQTTTQQTTTQQNILPQLHQICAGT